MEIEESEVKSAVIVPSVVAVTTPQEPEQGEKKPDEKKQEERKKPVLVIEREKVPAQLDFLVEKKVMILEFKCS